MLTRTVVSPLLGTSCHVVADARGRAVVVDPGMDVLDGVVEAVRDERLVVVGVVATHGHVDHTWGAAEVCDAFDVPLRVHAADADRVDDPFGTLGALGHELERTARAAGRRYRPAPVEAFTHEGDGTVRLALGAADDPWVLTGLHAPGHTPGSTVLLPGDGLALTGDVLFAGTIGRTDLPGGDARAMTATLARLAGLPPATVVLPGHGPSTTVERELDVNPYLRAG